VTVEDEHERLKRLLEQASDIISSALAATGALASIQEDAWTYSAAVFTIAGREATFMGSGIFVLASGRPHLLTAAHVWQDFSRADGFALKIDEGSDSLVVRPDRERVRVLPEVMPGPSKAGRSTGRTWL